MAHVAEWKKEEVNELKDLIDKYDVIIAIIIDILFNSCNRRRIFSLIDYS